MPTHVVAIMRLGTAVTVAPVDHLLTPQEVEEFLAKGMLINTILGLRLPDIAGSEPCVKVLLACLLDDAADDVVTLSTEHPPLVPYRARRGLSP